MVGVAAQGTGEEALAGLREHGVADQTGFVLAITEAAPGCVGAEAEFAEHVVGAEEAREAGELGVGLDQVVAGGVGAFDEQAVFALGQLEVRRGGGVDGREGGARVVGVLTEADIEATSVAL